METQFNEMPPFMIFASASQTCDRVEEVESLVYADASDIRREGS